MCSIDWAEIRAWMTSIDWVAWGTWAAVVAALWLPYKARLDAERVKADAERLALEKRLEFIVSVAKYAQSEFENVQEGVRKSGEEYL